MMPSERDLAQALRRVSTSFTPPLDHPCPLPPVACAGGRAAQAGEDTASTPISRRAARALMVMAVELAVLVLIALPAVPSMAGCVAWLVVVFVFAVVCYAAARTSSCGRRRSELTS